MRRLREKSSNLQSPIPVLVLRGCQIVYFLCKVCVAMHTCSHTMLSDNTKLKCREAGRKLHANKGSFKKKRNYFFLIAKLRYSTF